MLLKYSFSLDESIYLYVVNHPEGRSAVEIFKFFQDEKYLLYLRTVTHELLTRYIIKNIYFRFVFVIGKGEGKWKRGLKGI